MESESLTTTNAAADLALDYEAWRELERDAITDPTVSEPAYRRVIETRENRERAMAVACRRYLEPNEILVVNGVGYIAAGDSMIRFRVVGSFRDVPESIGSIGPGKDGA